MQTFVSNLLLISERVMVNLWSFECLHISLVVFMGTWIVQLSYSNSLAHLPAYIAIIWTPKLVCISLLTTFSLS